MNKWQPWSQEQIDFIYANYKSMYKKDILVEINKLGPEKTYACLKSFYARKNLVSGLDCRFKNGGIPHNKGKKMPIEVYKKLEKTFLKEGHTPWNTKPIGTETIFHKNGKVEYVYVKIAQPNVWKAKHHIIWEEAHGQKIQPGELIIFLDGNKLNFDVNNLQMVNQKEHVRLNKDFKIYKDPKEKTVCLDIIRINNKIRGFEK